MAPTGESIHTCIDRKQYQIPAKLLTLAGKLSLADEAPMECGVRKKEKDGNDNERLQGSED